MSKTVRENLLKDYYIRVDRITRAEIAARLVQATNLTDPAPQYVCKLFREMLSEVSDFVDEGEVK